jgi:anti-sigma factor RsiW
MSSPVCVWVRSVLSAYLDGELKPSTAAAVRRHLKRCESCNAHFRLLEATWEVLDTAKAPPVRSGFTSHMMARLVEEKELERLEERLRSRRRFRGVVAATAGMAAGLLVGLVLAAWTGLPAEPTSPIEREACRSLSFLEDEALLDEIALVEVMERLASESGQAGGT